MKSILPSLRCDLAESPIWDDRSQSLFWVDITLGRLHSFSPPTDVHRCWDFHEKISCIGLTEGHDLLIAGVSGIWRFTPRDGQKSLWAHFPPQPVGMRPNDGKVGPDGAFWVGTMQDQQDRGPSGKLLRFTSDGQVECMLNGLVTPNGLAWSPNGCTLYLAETRAMSVTRWAFDPSTGRMYDPTLFLTLNESQGKPDGACIDAEGNYWICGIYSGHVYAYTPEGSLKHRVPVGTSMVTMPCFGGSELDTLYVTSLTETNGSPGTVSSGRIAGTCGRLAWRMMLR